MINSGPPFVIMNDTSIMACVRLLRKILIFFTLSVPHLAHSALISSTYCTS
jgi:hypothetical protein